MTPASTHSKNAVEYDIASVNAGSSSSISDARAPANVQIISTTPIGQRTRDVRRRNAISLAAGQTGAMASTASESRKELAAKEDMIMVDAANSQVSAAQLSPSEDSVMGGAGAMPPIPGCKPEQVHSRTQTLACPDLTYAQTREQQLEQETELSPKSKEKSNENETGKGNGRTAGNNTFLSPTHQIHAELAESNDMSRYIVDAPPLPNQGNGPESSCSRGKGKGKAADALFLSATPLVKAPTSTVDKEAPSSFAAERVVASVKRRVANYAVTHPFGWFDDLPPVNEELFQDSPHKEYKMVLIHTARCGICLQYNKGTLFMCAACTVSICEGCADGKCGVTATNNAAGDDDVVMDNAGEGEAGESADARKLDWYGPYHEVFRRAYLEWKTEGVRTGAFTSTRGVEFKAGGGKQGGRKRKAT